MRDSFMFTFWFFLGIAVIVSIAPSSIAGWMRVPVGIRLLA